MKVYIAGPMTGYPDYNHPRFIEAEEFLRRELGWECVNPATLETPMREAGLPGGNGDGSALDLYLRRDFYELVQCDGIVLLDGWRKSAGANAELAVARWLALDVFTLSGTTLRVSNALPVYLVVSETWRKFGDRAYQRQLEETRDG